MGNKAGMNNKKEAIYKICMALAIAVFIVSLYLNNETTIEYMVDAKRDRAAASDAAVGAADGAPDAEAQDADGQNVDAQDVSAPDAGAQDADGQSVGTADVDKAFNFMLYDKDGAGKEFSDYRGDIVFMVFWNPQSNDSIQQLDIMKSVLRNSEVLEQGIPNISLLSVYVPAGDDEKEAALGVAGDSEKEAALGVADDTEEDAALGVAGDEYPGFDADGLEEFIDAGAELASLFLLSEYPTTYAFYPNGELCDYQKGFVDATRAGRLLVRAASGG